MKAARVILAFGLVGVAGFVVDSAVLYLLRGAIGLYVGRLVSFFCAAATTWLLNRLFTFKDRASGHHPLKEMAIYIGLMTIGGALNYLAFAIAIGQSVVIRDNPVIGVAIGSLAGMTANLLTSRFLLFRRAPVSGRAQK